MINSLSFSSSFVSEKYQAVTLHPVVFFSLQSPRAFSLRDDSDVVTVKHADKSVLDAYATYYKEKGFEVFENRSIGESLYIALKRGEEGIFLNYYGVISTLTAVCEKDSSYFEFSAPAGD